MTTSQACIRTTTAAAASPMRRWASWPVRTASRHAVRQRRAHGQHRYHHGRHEYVYRRRPGLTEHAGARRDVMSASRACTSRRASHYDLSRCFRLASGCHRKRACTGVGEESDMDAAVLHRPEADVGCEYDGDVVRINSQSGKGGVGFIMGAEVRHRQRHARGTSWLLRCHASDHIRVNLLPDEIY